MNSHTIGSHKFVFLVCLLSASSFAEPTAEPTQLTLDQCLSIAHSVSPAARMARLDSLGAKARWAAAWGEALPQLRISGQLPSWQETIRDEYVWDPETGNWNLTRVPSGEMRWQNRVSLEQALPWGATATASSQMYRRRWYTNLPGSDDEYTEYALLHRAAVEQPLLAGNPVRRELSYGKIAWRSALIQNEIQQREITYRTTRLFYALVTAREELLISSKDVAQGDSAVALARRKLKAGLIPEVELLNLQVDLARREAAYKQAQDAAEYASDNLKLGAGIPLDREIEPLYQLESNAAVTAPHFHQQGARLETSLAELSLTRQNIETKASQLTQRVRAALQLYYEMEYRGEKIDEFEYPGNRNIGVVLSFDIPVYGFGSTSGALRSTRAALERQKLELQTLKESQLTELRSAVRSVERASDRIEIAGAALKLAERSLQITTERFSSGQVSSRELIDAQLELTRTRKESLSARIDYELAVANLERIAPVDR